MKQRNIVLAIVITVFVVSVVALICMGKSIGEAVSNIRTTQKEETETMTTEKETTETETTTEEPSTTIPPEELPTSEDYTVEMLDNHFVKYVYSNGAVRWFYSFGGVYYAAENGETIPEDAKAQLALKDKIQQNHDEAASERASKREEWSIKAEQWTTEEVTTEEETTTFVDPTPIALEWLRTNYGDCFEIENYRFLYDSEEGTYVAYKDAGTARIIVSATSSKEIPAYKQCGSVDFLVCRIADYFGYSGTDSEYYNNFERVRVEKNTGYKYLEHCSSRFRTEDGTDIFMYNRNMLESIGWVEEGFGGYRTTEGVPVAWLKDDGYFQIKIRYPEESEPSYNNLILEEYYEIINKYQWEVGESMEFDGFGGSSYAEPYLWLKGEK